MSNTLRLVEVKEYIDENLLHSLCTKRPYFGADYMHTYTLCIPDLAVLEKCVNASSTHGILSPHEHYLLVIALRMTSNEVSMPLANSDVFPLRNISGIIMWRGKTLRIVAHPFDMYWTDPGFHEVFMQRLREFVSEMKKVRIYRYVLSDKRGMTLGMYNFLHYSRTPLTLSTRIDKVDLENQGTRMEKIQLVHSVATRLLDSADNIYDVIVGWTAMKCFSKKILANVHFRQLFEPRLIRKICAFLMQKSDNSV